MGRCGGASGDKSRSIVYTSSSIVTTNKAWSQTITGSVVVTDVAGQPVRFNFSCLIS